MGLEACRVLGEEVLHLALWNLGNLDRSRNLLERPPEAGTGMH